MKIISSLYVYKGLMFVGYLDGKIVVHNLNEGIYRYKFLRNKNIHENLLLLKELFTNDFIIDMQAYKNVLFVSTSSRINSFDLLNNPEQGYIFEKEITDCSHIKIDYVNGYLFAVSATRGIVTMNIKNPLMPQYKSDLNTKNEKGLSRVVVAGMDVFQKAIFLAVRNIGIIRIDYKDKKITPQIIRMIKKITLKDPQDVKYCNENGYLYIADAEKGLIVLDTRDNALVSSIYLPNDDFPRSLVLYNQDCIIKGARGLYFYNFNEAEIYCIINDEVGLLTQYDNTILYSTGDAISLIYINQRPRVIKIENPAIERISYWYGNQLLE